MNTALRLIIIFIVLVILVGCDSTNSTAIPSQSTPENSGIEISQTATETARPSFTPRPSLTPDLTQTAIMQDRNIVQAAEQTLIAQYPQVCSVPYAPQKFSPNGLWMEEFCYNENDQSTILTLSNKDTQVLWKLVYRDYSSHKDMFPDGGLAIVHWSTDGRYAYFNSFTGGDGGECFLNFLQRGDGLFRIDLKTGNTTTILPLFENFGWYHFSFSRTDRRLVYGVRSRDLKVLDITNGQLKEILPLKEYSQSGNYVWSPDGLKFVYSTVMDENQGVIYSLRLADTQIGSERILLESSENCFAASAWTEDNILTIESYDKNYDRTLIQYDLNSNTVISEFTATPGP